MTDTGTTPNTGLSEAADDGAAIIAAIVRLSPRQAECLRLVFQRRTSKEIAAITGLAAGTVDTYIAEAVTTLGARNRRHAAELLQFASPSLIVQADPGKVEPEFSGVSNVNTVRSSDAQPQRRVGWADLLPLRRHGASGNDLQPLFRLGWIFVLAALLAIGFGMLAVGADVVSRLYAGR